MSDTVFDLPPRLAAKRDPALVAGDEKHFAAIARTIEHTIADLSGRLDAERRAPGRSGQQAVERDQEIHRLTARLRTLRRFGVDLCLGRVVPADTARPLYVGRLGLTDSDCRQLLVDWRSPAAEPFFAATHAEPAGLLSRRRYRWTGGRITDYWDEVFTADGLAQTAALDDQSAFIASLAGTRTDRMRDVLGTIQADQDAIIRASSRGALVVDGGPGTGKTVVALHRAAYLLYADPRLREGRGGLLFVGPHQPYLDYVGDVLPGLGEDDVRTGTLRDLVAEGAAVTPEPDAEVARLKSSVELVSGIETAVRLYEQPPTEPVVVDTEWAELVLRPAEWAEAIDVVVPGTPHNAAREQVWQELLTVIGQPDAASSAELRTAFNRVWPLLEPTDVVGDLWTVPAYLRMSAPSLPGDAVRRLQRDDPTAWTLSDLPLLDAARRRIGDPQAARRAMRQARETALERERRGRVIDELIASDDSELLLMTSLRHEDLRDALVDEPEAEAVDPFRGPFAHVVVDEAQELTDAEWQMLLARCPSGSFTVVGDRAQARQAFGESWDERLARVGLDDARTASLSINYRTPAEIMAAAEPVIRAVLPDADVPTSVRSTGVPVRHGSVADIDEVVGSWLAAHPDGIACVIGDSAFEPMARVRSLSPVLVKGLEFDLVVLVRPERFGAVDAYVAMTRANGELVVLSGQVRRAHEQEEQRHRGHHRDGDVEAIPGEGRVEPEDRGEHDEESEGP